MGHSCNLKKSDTLFQDLKSEGNYFYEKRKFKDALLKYNASLCYGSAKSENGLCNSYANRSAVCFEMKKYDECLRNIKLAMKNNYPKANLHVLKLREEKCLDLIRKQKNNSSKWDFFKLSFKSKMTNAQIADVLEVQFSEKFGRFIVTREDVKAGSILAIEKPFCSVLLSNSRHVTVDSFNKYYRCAFCLKENIFGLIPCSGCCSSMFCEECYDEAFESFHKYECEVMDDLIQSGSVHIALRIFFIALSAFDGSIEQLEKFMIQIDSADDKNYSILNFNASNENYVKNYLRFLNSLSRSDKNFCIDEHLRILKNHSKINKLFETHADFIKDFILRQCQTNDHYFHGIFSSNLNDENCTNQMVQAPIGTGWFPFHSLINHSCASNVMRINVDGKLVLFAVRFIKKDSQIFDCYKVSFTKHLKNERQERLQSEFGFKCECEACEGDYKMPPQVKNIIAAKAAVRIEKEIYTCNGKGLPKIFKEITQLMNENYKSYPSLELILLQKSFAHVLLSVAS